MKPIKAYVYLEEPEEFCSKLTVAGTFVRCAGKILMLKRHPSRPQGLSWGIPAGKMDGNETSKEVAIRELYEETGLLVSADELSEVVRFYVKHPEYDFIFDAFAIESDKLPELVLGEEEHLEARWVTPEEAMQLPLIAGGHEVVEYYVHWYAGR